MRAPTPENYKQWVRDREARTSAALSRERITGAEIRQENLSVRLLFEFGFELDTTTDTMVRQPERTTSGK